jgi:hypothetical protein
MFLATTSNVALIRFTTDINVSKTGFAIKFTAGNHAGKCLQCQIELN